MSLLNKIAKEKLPRHIAIIMDGNGRWAKQRNQDRTSGHREGIASVRRVIECSARLQIEYVTLYAFSTENWNRPKEEVDTLMDLMVQAVVKETPELLKNNISLQTIGDTMRLPEKTRDALYRCIEDTSVSTGLTLTLALSYSSKWEITQAVKSIVKEYGGKPTDDITEDVISAHLATRNTPDPDLLIRTGGEKRISNFLLWQAAYAELYFTDTLWPDFRDEALYEAIVDYQGRERRYGKTSEQVVGQ
ncbi:MAG: isoprenyl transferase [Prevotella sp.]|jgi:undecaprenyl diphosphate synthase|nr:isoprenyl transferase [Prevotella sp.]